MRASLESHGKLAAKDDAHINVSQPFTVFTYHINHIRDPNAHQFIQPTSSRTARSAWESPLNLVIQSLWCRNSQVNSSDTLPSRWSVHKLQKNSMVRKLAHRLPNPKRNTLPTSSIACCFRNSKRWRSAYKLQRDLVYLFANLQLALPLLWLSLQPLWQLLVLPGSDQFKKSKGPIDSHFNALV